MKPCRTIEVGRANKEVWPIEKIWSQKRQAARA